MIECNRVVSVSEMKERERLADEAGLSYYQMMENAGTAAYEVIKKEYPCAKSMLVVCGKGNNGGDGFVVARLAANDGIDVKVILAEGEPVTEDATTNYKKLPDVVEAITDISQLKREEVATNADQIKFDVLAADNKHLRNPDIVVDALYGTGFHGNLREKGKKACDIINETNATKVALDIPSGCAADTCEVADGAVNADITIAFDSWKKVHVSDITNCGRCILVDIGIQFN